MTAIVTEDVPPPSRIRPEIPPRARRDRAEGARARTRPALPDRRRCCERARGRRRARGHDDVDGRARPVHARAVRRAARAVDGDRRQRRRAEHRHGDQRVGDRRRRARRCGAAAAIPAIAPSAHSEDVENELRRTTQLRKSTNPDDDSGSGTSMPEVAPLGMTWSGPVPATGPQAAAPPPSIAVRGSGSIPPHRAAAGVDAASVRRARRRSLRRSRPGSPRPSRRGSRRRCRRRRCRRRTRRTRRWRRTRRSRCRRRRTGARSAS